MRNCAIALGIILSTAGAFSSSCFAQSNDARARDGLELFAAFCVSTNGTKDHALAVLGNGNALANRLPNELVQKMQGGRAGGLAWAIRSPHQAELLLEYEPRGICGVRIADSDELSVQQAFEAAARTAAARVGTEVRSEPALVKYVDGVRTTYQAFAYSDGGRTAHLAVTTAERRLGMQQHFMTFGYVETPTPK